MTALHLVISSICVIGATVVMYLSRREVRRSQHGELHALSLVYDMYLLGLFDYSGVGPEEAEGVLRRINSLRAALDMPKRTP